MNVDELGMTAGAEVRAHAVRHIDPDRKLVELKVANQLRSRRRAVLAVAAAALLLAAATQTGGLPWNRSTPPTPNQSAPRIQAVHHNGVIAVGSAAVDPVIGGSNPALLADCAGGALAWAPDGLRYICTLGGKMYLYRVGSTDPARDLTNVDGPDYSAIAWSPNGTLLARASNAAIQLYSPTDGRLLRVIRLAPTMDLPLTLSWSPDGSALVFPSRINDHEHALFIIDADGSGLRQLKVAVATGEDGPIAASWSPDGTRIAYLEGGRIVAPGTRETVMLIDPAGTARVRVADGGLMADKQAVPNLTWSPDGHQLAVVGVGIEGHQAWELWVMQPDGTHLHLLYSGVSDPNAAWRPVP